MTVFIRTKCMLVNYFTTSTFFVVAGVGFEPTIFGLWAQNADRCTTPRYCTAKENRTPIARMKILSTNRYTIAAYFVLPPGFEPELFTVKGWRLSQFAYRSIFKYLICRCAATPKNLMNYPHRFITGFISPGHCREGVVTLQRFHSTLRKRFTP